MTIGVTVIADSISPQDIRLTTMQLRYPRFIHAEFMTHRVFSRSASSSRAIPVERLIADIERDPAMPVFWGKNQKGMQALEEITGRHLNEAKLMWLQAMRDAVQGAKNLAYHNAHKQIVNRLIEPFSHINVVVTATDWDNFYALRRHEDAQPEMKALADAMWGAQEASEPRPLLPDEWHLPYVDMNREDKDLPIYCIKGISPLDAAIRASVARCARVSYLTHEGRKPSLEEDMALYDRLMGSAPLHASPAEHQATPDSLALYRRTVGLTWMNAEQHGNLHGWRQYRKTLTNEAIEKYKSEKQ